MMYKTGGLPPFLLLNNIQIYQKMQTWIKYPETAPESNTVVLAVINDEPHGITVEVVWYFSGCFRRMGAGMEKTHNVTHWMPMPKPPQM